jgi:hypothetical protein
MKVSEAREIARAWVMDEAGRTAGFRGGLFHGSINWLAEDAELPAESDVDVLLVVAGPTPAQKIGKLLARGLIIDAAYLAQAEVQSADQVLGIAHLAGSLRSERSIITDPTGQLRAIQAQVAIDYAKIFWVTRRCEQAQAKVRANLAGLNPGGPFFDQVIGWLFGTGVTTHILLAAGLKNPTVRKRYLALRALLAEYGQPDLYERLLELLGCARMRQAQARAHLVRLEGAFDAAQAVIRSPFAFAADVTPLARPVAIAGSRALIERGDWREAVFWMAVTSARCMQVLSADAPPGWLAQHEPGCRALLADLGIHAFADLEQRSQAVRDALPAIWAAAEAIMARSPEIKI